MNATERQAQSRPAATGSEDTVQAQRLRLFELLAASAVEMIGATDLNLVLGKVFAAIRAELHLDAFLHYRHADGRLILEAQSGLPPKVLRDGGEIEFGDSICGEVARTRHAIVRTGICTTADPQGRIVRHAGLDTYACFPLIHGETLLGTLGFGRRDTAFSPAEIRFIETVCSYVTLVKYRISIDRALREGLAERDRLLAKHRAMEQKVIELTRISALGAVASTIAHELNQPLSAAANYLSVIRLAPETAGGRAAELARSAEAQLLRAGEILRRIRGMVSREGHSAEAAALGPIAGEAIGLVRGAAGGRLPSFEVSTDARASRAIVDSVQLVQILVNLLRDALDATENVQGARVAIETRRISLDEVEIRVVHNGVCLAGDIHAAMAHPRSSAFAGGLGLGLSIARNLVETEGDIIRVEETPGGGTTFCLTVPAAPGD